MSISWAVSWLSTRASVADPRPIGLSAPDVQNINHSTGRPTDIFGRWDNLQYLAHVGVHRRYWCNCTFKQRQSLIFGHSGLELDLHPSSSLSLPDLKELIAFTLCLMEWASCRVAILTDFVARDPALDCVIHQHVGEPIHLTLSATGMYAGKSRTTMGNFGYQFTCGILLCRREEVLSAPRVLLVLKASFTVSLSSLDVFWFCGGALFCFCLGCFCCFLCL